MQTRLGIFCDRIIEAGLLATVAVVSVFFNTFSERTFEPDKAALLRSLVLLMAAAWLIRTIEGRGTRLLTLRRRIRRAATASALQRQWSSLLLALLLAVVYCLATVASVAPNLSLWGSYQRAQGLYSLLSYIGIFFLARHVLRSHEQVNRLVTVVLLTSVPVVLYGWLQQLGLDPQGWGGSLAGRVFSTMGNPIFLGGYLIMVMPLTVARIVLAVSALRQDREKKPFRFIQVGACSVLLLLQFGCLAFTQSRGPLVGLLGSAFLMLLLTAAVMRNRRLVLAVLMIAAVAGVLLVLLNVSSTPFPSAGELPYLGRFSRLLDPRSLTAQQRILTWQGTVALVASNPIHALIGYGPETLIVTLNRHFPPELVPLLSQTTIIFDRAHNAVLDNLATTGALGLIVYLSFVGAIVYYGLVRLGLLEGSVQRRAFIVAVGLGTLSGALVPRLLDGSWRMAGLGLAAGSVLGLTAYLVGHALVVDGPPKPHTDTPILLVALLTAIMAHFIEIQFGIAVVPTTLYFWLFAATALSLSQPARRQSTKGRKRHRSHRQTLTGERTAPTSQLGGDLGHGQLAGDSGTLTTKAPGKETQPARPRDLWTWMGWDPARAPESLLIGLLLATLGFGLIADPGLLRSRIFPLVGLLVLINFICHALLDDHTSARTDGPAQMRHTGSSTTDGPGLRLANNALLSLSWALVFLIAHVLGIGLGDDGTNSLTVYYAYVLLTVVAVASSQLQGQPRPQQSWRPQAVLIYIGLVLVAVWLTIVSNLNAVKADIYYKQAVAFGAAGHWDEGISRFEQALHLAPHQDFYTILLTGAYVQKAYTAATATEREAWMEKAEAALIQGWQRNPLYPDHSTKLGLLYRIWGEISSDPTERQEKLVQAETRYAEAAELSPHSIPVLNGWATVHITLENYDQAETILQRSLSLRPSMVETLLLLGDTYLAKELVDDAASAYAKALELDSSGALRIKQGEVQAYPSDPARYLQLALVYRELGQKAAALQEAQKAQRLAVGELPALAHVLASLEKQQ